MFDNDERESDILTVEQETEMIVKIFDATIIGLETLGISKETSLVAMLSQIAVQVEPSVLESALRVNNQFYSRLSNSQK
tara:strand:+ start:659 stop:895 length:237 start_codon:yes stop_codon:yes gene_type:complete